MKYIYVGNGAGVPGLPHEITDEEAQELGVEDVLRDALNNGAYVSCAATEKRREVAETGKTKKE